MKSKTIVFILALMLCMGAFAFPVVAYAQPDTTPPNITATLSGQILHIEATDSDSGVEAVFVDDNRINYRVDSALDVILKDYAGTGEYVSVYAVDFAGNKSKVVQIKNPHYVAPSAPATPAPTTKPAETPAPSETPELTESAVPAEDNPFTPDGTGTVQDNATDGDGKEFFTIVTPDENVFYLVIDRQRESENVYLLNTVTEDDLAALADKSKGTSGESAVTTPDPTPEPEPEPTPEPEPEPEKPAEKGNTGTIIFIIIAALVVGGAGYYFKILKPKLEQDSDEFDDDSDYDDFDYGDDYDTDPEDDDFYFSDEDDLSTDPIPDDEE